MGVAAAAAAENPQRLAENIIMLVHATGCRVIPGRCSEVEKEEQSSEAVEARR